MPRFDNVDRSIEPLANAAVAFAAAVMLRYVGWNHSCTHRRNVLRQMKMANLRASSQMLQMQADCQAD
eukprot:3162551-Alexandrium_andersonii.AAC.1